MVLFPPSNHCEADNFSVDASSELWQKASLWALTKGLHSKCQFCVHFTVVIWHLTTSWIPNFCALLPLCLATAVSLESKPLKVCTTITVISCHLILVCLPPEDSLSTLDLMSRVSVSPSNRGKSFNRSMSSGFLFNPWSIHSRAFIEAILDGVRGYRSRCITPDCYNKKRQFACQSRTSHNLTGDYLRVLAFVAIQVACSYQRIHIPTISCLVATKNYSIYAQSVLHFVAHTILSLKSNMDKTVDYLS